MHGWTPENLERLPEALGKAPNDFFGASHWIHFVLDNEYSAYRPLSTARGPAPDDSAESLEYRTRESIFADDFSYWQEDDAVPRREGRGYLVGFPVIKAPSGASEQTIHLWTDNENVLADTYAIPVGKLKGLYIYSSMYTDLQKDLDLQGIDGTSRLEVPVFRRCGDPEPYYAPATQLDIKAIVQRLETTVGPAAVIEESVPKFRFTVPRTFEDLTSLLDIE